MSQLQSTYPLSLEAGQLRSASQGRAGLALSLLLAMWILILSDVHYFLPTLIGMGPLVRRLPLLLLLPLGLIALQRARPEAIYWPLALFTLLHFVSVPLFAWNRGLALIGFKQMFVYFVLVTTTIALVRTPARLAGLLKLFLLSFPWFLLHGLPAGKVSWHTELANPDAFGPLGVMAIAVGYHFGAAAEAKRWRYVGIATAALGLVGVVASFARGAFLAAGVVLCLIWVRSPRKIATLFAGLVAAAVVFAAAAVLYPGGTFWSEMETIQEGTSSGTGRSRWQLWTEVGWEVFKEHPLFGVGANCVGARASEIVPAGLLEGRRANPGTLYHRQMHNIYIQLLSEQGLVGLVIWLVMLVDFARRLRRIRAPACQLAWNRSVGSCFDLRRISLGLEAAMVAFLAGGVFYNQLYRHWFYTLVLFALLLSELARPQPTRVSARSLGASSREPVATS